MDRPHRLALTWIGAAAALVVWGACTQDFDQFTPETSSQSTGSAATTGSGGGATTSTSSTGGMGGGATSGSGGAATTGPGGGGGPACGDGTEDPGEACDDGNVLPADGCSATCTVEDPDACPGPTILLTTAGLTIMGDTSGANNDAGQLPCGGGGSGDFVYEITPAQNGTLQATMTGPFQTHLYARDACPGSNSSNLACSQTHAPAMINLQVTAGEPIYLFADGFGGNTEEGPFTLTLALN